MTQDEIIELARQLKMPYYYQDNTIKDLKKLEAFAKLVAEKERKWIGLTDEEIEQLHTAWVLGGGFRQLCNAIEAKLKEKNT
jgi:hypothetical protein